MNKKSKMVTDHKGNKYLSERAMCNHYGVPLPIYTARLKKGWTLKDALETKHEKANLGTKTGFECHDHKGNEFSSFGMMCQYYKLPPTVVEGRLKLGWSLQNALTISLDHCKSRGFRCKDHLGNQFASRRDMAKHWGINHETFRYRLRMGWSLKDALETPVHK